MARQRRGSNVSSSSSVNDQVKFVTLPLHFDIFTYRKRHHRNSGACMIILQKSSFWDQAVAASSFTHAWSPSPDPRAHLAPGPASYTELSRMNVCKKRLGEISFADADSSKGGYCLAKRSASSFPPRSSRSALALGEKGSSCNYGTRRGPKDSAQYRGLIIAVQLARF